jgi:CheY-like chemotaxis protein
LRRIIGEDVELETILRPDATFVGDVGQVEQVLMNLATNARDAMPRGGTLTIETGLVEATDEFASVHGLERPGTHVVISVKDSGVGIDERTMKSIFEPFFTTKEEGRGTGLGLAIVYGIVQQHHGNVEVDSEVGRGTTVRVYLPAQTAADEETGAGAPEAPLIGGNETLLLAEDDPNVRGLLEKLLSEFGYCVIAAEDGEDAVAKFVANEGKVALCILDVIMPKKGGKEACEEIRRRDPRARVVFTSGYTEDRLRAEGLPEGCALLTKPASPTVILATIRESLDGPPG